jgi:putative membrane protein
VTIRDLPTLNAVLNTSSAVLLATGWVLIRRRQRDGHRLAMLGAFAASAAFLTSYLVYHSQVGSVRFTGQGPVRTVYFAVLLSHTLLAAAIVPLVLFTLSRALRGRFDAHRAVARWTLPLWMWVSVSGVVVYWMLYRL